MLNEIIISTSKNGQGKIYTYDFSEKKVSLEELGEVANRFSISGPIYKDGHRKAENITKGSSIILIDCDEPGQAETVEGKLDYYDYMKVPSASNLKHPYKWHFIIPTQNPLSVFPAAMRWQVEQFLGQIGIADDMIDTTGSYDIARQFAPASIGMTLVEADELSEVHHSDMELRAPVSESPIEYCTNAAKSKDINIKGIKASKLPAEHLWFKGNAITYADAVKAVRVAYESRENPDDSVIVSGFGCPHDNQDHTGDRTIGYGFAFIGDYGDVVVKCTGNCCKSQPYFKIPESIEEVKATKFIDAKTDPIDPTNFAEMTKQRIRHLEPQFEFGKNMLQGFAFYGATYNECVYRNRNNLSPMRHTIPAATGSGKSVSAKLYLSEIAQMGYSGLLIVKKVDNAIQTVKEINEMTGATTAACIYTVSRDNADSDERVHIDELQTYRIAVISHSMFLSRSHTQKDIHLIRDFNDCQRDCVIIDEQIDFSRTISFSTDELKAGIGLVHNIQDWNKIDDALSTLLNNEKHSELDTSGYPDLSRQMREGINKLRRGLGYVGTKKDRRFEDREAEDRDWMKRLLDRIAIVFSYSNIITNQGKIRYYSTSQDLTSQFGSVVILDATAKALPLYRSHMQNRDDILMYELPEKIRDYKNVTLHVCKNKHYRQSNDKLVLQAKASQTIGQIVDHYLELFYTLTADGSKLLVVTFKDIEEIFRTGCRDDNIEFIHWGQHEGTNDYSSFGKAAAVGWYRKSKRKYLQDIDAVNDAISDYSPFSNSVLSDAAAMIRGGLGADFVQFFNRTRSRIAIDKDGNCAPTDFYIFDDLSSDSPIPIIQKEMPGIQTVDWKPARSYPVAPKNRVEDRSDKIVEWFLAQPNSTIRSESVLQHFALTKKNMKDTCTSKYFQALRDEADRTMRTKRGRTGWTVFDIPERFDSPLETDIVDQKKMRQFIGI